MLTAEPHPASQHSPARSATPDGPADARGNQGLRRDAVRHDADSGDVGTSTTSATVSYTASMPGASTAAPDRRNEADHPARISYGDDWTADAPIVPDDVSATGFGMEVAAPQHLPVSHSTVAPAGGGAGTPRDAIAVSASALGTGLPAAAEDVVARWNPHGAALLRAMKAAAGRDGGVVRVVGGVAEERARLCGELGYFVPRIGLTDPAGECGGDERPVPVALVVLDAGSPIGRALLGTVQRLRADGTRIVFALDGIHAHEAWRAVRWENSRLLAEGRDEVGGDEIVPVSARMAEVARLEGDGALLDRSGLGLLHARLVAAAGAGALADQAAIVRRRVVAETRCRIEAQIEWLRDGGDVAAMRAERARLLAVRDGGRGPAMAVLRNRLQLARVDLLHEVGARVRSLHAELREEIDRLPNGERDGFPDRVHETVEKITEEIDHAIRRRVRELCRQVRESMGGSDGNSFFTAPGRPARVGPNPGRRRGGVEDHLMIALGASAGFGLGRLVVAPLTLLQAFDYAIMPVSLLLGAAAAGWVVRARRQLADSAHLQQWLADGLVNAKAQLEQRVATALVEAEERLTEEVLGSTMIRMVETDRRIGELEAHLRQAAHRRPALRIACDRDLAALEFV